MEEQLDLFNTPANEMTALWEALERVKASHTKVRKRLFAEVKNLEEELVKTKAEVERLKFHTEMKPSVRWTA